jgi:rhamnulokinase
MAVVAAVDCGATSVRVCRVDLDAPTLTAEVVLRVPHAPVRDPAGHLRWDWDLIIDAVIRGIERCLQFGPVASIGVDTWAVDYGLLDESGQLVGAPYSYRDHRTDDYREIVDAFGADEMYRLNGLQLQPFNTIFQLARHDPAELERATRLLWLPELIVHALTGVAVTERTSAGSSGLVDLATGDWSSDLLALSGVEAGLLGDIVPAGRFVGSWRGIPVALVGGHDTASAVAGMGVRSRGGSAFVASGTWMLAGVERAAADTSAWARTRNFTNEAGALDGFRFLRNVTGFWLLEQCRPHWADIAIDELVAAAEAVPADDMPVVDVDADVLRAPADMLGAYTDLAGLPRDVAPAIVTRSIIESIAQRTTEVLDQVRSVATFDDVILFGGAARMAVLARRIAELSGCVVRVGPAEAATLGNAIVQGVAGGVFESLEHGRSRIPATDPGDDDRGARR